jgi:hypothetical protein
MKTKLYLDTSIPSAFFDTSKPVRQLITQKWFENEASNNSYTVQEDEVLWELHEIRHKLHDELKKKPLDEINRDARALFESWQRAARTIHGKDANADHQASQ